MCQSSLIDRFETKKLKSHKRKG